MDIEIYTKEEIANLIFEDARKKGLNPQRVEFEINYRCIKNSEAVEYYFDQAVLTLANK